MSAPDRSRRLHRAGLAAIVALYLAHAMALEFTSDDGYIVFQYARNLLAGHGLVYNPGERVEGYTTFLWTVCIAAVDWILPGSHIPAVAKVLGLACGAATVALLGALGRWLAPGGAWHRALLAPLLLACDSSFCAWSTGGLESQLFSLLVLGAAWSYLRAVRGERSLLAASILFALAALTRPEGALLFGATTVFEAARRLWRAERVLDRSLIPWIVPFALIFGTWYAWRYAYYGWPLPNTFYVKVSSPADQWRRGLDYLARFLRTHAWFAFPLALVPLLRRQVETVYLFALVALYAAYVTAVGGDGLVLSRFCTYLAPIAYVLIQEGAADLLERVPARLAAVRTVAAGALALFAAAASAESSLKVLVLPERSRWLERQSELSFPGLGTDHGYLWFDAYFVDRLAAAARWLDLNAPPGALVASTPAGSIAYHMGHPVLDMLGLNDEHIAHVEVADLGTGRAGHEKGDGRYVLSRAPEYVLLGNVAVLPRPLTLAEMPAKLVRRSEEELWALPEFHRDYELVSVRLAEEGPFQYFTFFRRKPGASGSGR